MRPLLYLDTARLGQMSSAAKDAQIDFVRLSAEEPSSLYFEEFLRNGFNAWPSSYQNRFPGLHTWNGVAGLKQSIRRLAGAPNDWQVLLASRSMSVVQLATGCMFRVCRNVLTTDLSWQTYQQAIEDKARRTGNRISTVSIRDEILYRGWSADDVARHLAAAFVDQQCDGLFLPAVDHLGIRLPIRKIVNRIRERSELRFCFIDAAQAFCQVSLDDCVDVADFIVAGSHKWMGAYLPTGIGLFGQPRTREVIARRLNHNRRLIHPQDPLLQFTEQLESATLDGHSETANLHPLFACAGAAFDKLDSHPIETPHAVTHIDAAIQSIPRPPGGWRPVHPASEMRSRIALLRASEDSSCYATPNDVRSAWLESGAVVSAFKTGIVRVSFDFFKNSGPSPFRHK